VVFVNVNDPVAQGLVASLDRPGANVTGLSTLSGALSAKRVELVRQVLPGLSRLAVLWNMANAGMALANSETEQAAEQLGIRVLAHGVSRPDDVADALEVLSVERPDALIVLPSVPVSPPTLIQDFAARRQLPTMYSDRGPVDLGGLMALGPNYAALQRRAAWYVDRILRGASPADLRLNSPAVSISWSTPESLEPSG
jgi:putative ABC transport system substrate-binding protein